MIAALRSAHTLRRHWKVTAIAAFSLSIAIAVSVIGLSISNTLLMLPPAAPAADSLVTIYNRSPGKPVDQISYPDYEYYRQNNHVFTDIAAAPDSIGLLADFKFEGRDVRVLTRPVSENYFAVLGIRPHLGRCFSPGDDRSGNRVAVMTYSCWRRLGADVNIVGKTLAKHTIVGVAPKEFTGSFYGLNGDLLTTLGEADNNRTWMTQRSVRRLFLIARLKPAVARRRAQSEMDALSGQLASAYPTENKDRAAVLARATLLSPQMIPTAQLMSAILIAFVLLVLLIACANAANLLLAVAVGRRQETVIKLALGAPRGRLIREFLVESTMLCALSGVLGSAVAAFAITRYSDFTVVFPMFGAIPFGLNLRLDLTVITFTLVLIAIASVATGLAPALYASSPLFAQMLMDETVVGGTRRERRRNTLAIIQVAVCTLVLIGMGLCQRNLYNLRHADPGFDARNLVAASAYLEAEGYSEVRGKEFYKTLHQTVAALPGVESASIAFDLPLLGSSETKVQSPNLTKPLSVSHTVVDVDYFSTLGIKLLAGRTFNSIDREGSPDVAVINHKLAGMLWPLQDPHKSRVILTGEPARKFMIVGVVADGKYLDLSEASARPFLYYAPQPELSRRSQRYCQDPWRSSPVGGTIGTSFARSRPEHHDSTGYLRKLDKSDAGERTANCRIRRCPERARTGACNHWPLRRTFLLGERAEEGTRHPRSFGRESVATAKDGSAADDADFGRWSLNRNFTRRWRNRLVSLPILRNRGGGMDRTSSNRRRDACSVAAGCLLLRQALGQDQPDGSGATLLIGARTFLRIFLR